MNIQLNIKSIIKYELMTDKSFNSLDYTNEDEMKKLLYCIVLSNNKESFDFEEFEILLNSNKLSKEIITKFQKELKIIGQFSSKEVSGNTSNSIEDNKPEILFIKDIASLLIIQAGLDVNYVMNEMSINEIGLFINTYNNKIKEELESKRLFTWLSILPHIDGQKITPQKLYPFPWEIENIKNSDNNNIEKLRNEFENIMENGCEIINKINSKNK